MSKVVQELQMNELEGVTVEVNEERLSEQMVNPLNVGFGVLLEYFWKQDEEAALDR